MPLVATYSIINRKLMSYQNGYPPLQPFQDLRVGSLKFSDGSTYQGEIRNGGANGQGVLRVPNGTVAKGNYRDNYLCGEGVMFYADGGGNFSATNV